MYIQFQHRFHCHMAFVLSAAMVSVLLVGCESLPGTKRQQGAVIGGAGGAAAGATVAGDDDRMLGALIGGLGGAGGGYLIGAQMEKTDAEPYDVDDARDATTKARNEPATVADVQTSTTADLNADGFVTLDEVVAMERANLTDNEMVARLRATNQIFELTGEQEAYLRDEGVSRYVVDRMRQMDTTANATRNDVISRPR